MVSKALKWSWERTKTLKPIANKIASIFLLVIALFFSIITYSSLDAKPAVFDDYLPLYEKLLSVEEDPANLLSSDGTITIKNGIIEYTVENGECSLTGTYDKNYKLIKKTQKDKNMSKSQVFFNTLLIGLIIGAGGYVVSYGLILFVAFIIYAIYGASSKKAYQNEIGSKVQTKKSSETNEPKDNGNDAKKVSSYKGYETEMNTG